MLATAMVASLIAHFLVRFCVFGKYVICLFCRLNVCFGRMGKKSADFPNKSIAETADSWNNMIGNKAEWRHP